jgi:hypothetical protein
MISTHRPAMMKVELIKVKNENERSINKEKVMLKCFPSIPPTPPEATYHNR